MPLALSDDTPKITDLVNKFMSFVEVTDSCWLWRGVKNPQKYGMFSYKGSKVCAHRMSYSLFVGTIPKGLFIDHDCHNKDLSCQGELECIHRSCVNPQHLQVVTQQQNLKNSKLTHAGKNRCKRGHLFGKQRGYSLKLGYRRCYTCDTAKAKRRWLQTLERRKYAT